MPFLSVLSWIASNWKLIAMVGIGVLLFSSGWYIKGNIDDGVRARELKVEIDARIVAENKANALSSQLERILANSRNRMRKLNQKLGGELAKNPVYNTCIVPLNGVRIRNEAVTGTSTPR